MSQFQEYLELANLDKKPHQSKAVAWCLEKETIGTQIVNEGKQEMQEKQDHPIIIYGGLIADEMGLGKTIQMVGTIISNPLKNTLIVLPCILIDQWKTFMEKTTSLKIYLYHGTKKITDINALQKYDIIITTYGLIGKTYTVLREIEWSRVVFDEAHHMRNRKTSLFTGALALKSKIRWLITGTPIQNSRHDFYSLCEQLSIPKQFYSDHANQHFIASNIIIKRTKEQANIVLPDLIMHQIEVKWNLKPELDLAKEIHRVLNFSNIKEETNETISSGSVFGKQKIALYIRAKQSCIDIDLMSNKMKEILEQNQNQDEDQDFNQVKSILEACTSFNKTEKLSSKLQSVTNKIIENRDNDMKKLVFCHYHGEIDRIKSALEKAGVKVATFDGRTTRDTREELLLSKAVDVLILQIQTGCEGLNLQHFNEIYFVCPHWNPAIEDQAIARCHRIGQKNPTHVYKFYMESFDIEKTTQTFDKYVLTVQESKRTVMREIITDPKQSL